MIRKSGLNDLDWIVKLSNQKRLNYEKFQPIFWKMAQNSDHIQKKYLEEELQKEEVLAFCFDDKSAFIVGKIINPPEVYDSGLTLMIDDFCVSSPSLWKNQGKKLLQEIILQAKSFQVKQILVVCGNHDKEKSEILKELNLQIASNWFTTPI